MCCISFTQGIVSDACNHQLAIQSVSKQVTKKLCKTILEQICDRIAFQTGVSYCQGENVHGTMNAVVKKCTPGVMAPMVSRHLGTVRAACRALRSQCASGVCESEGCSGTQCRKQSRGTHMQSHVTLLPATRRT